MAMPAETTSPIQQQGLTKMIQLTRIDLGKVAPNACRRRVEKLANGSNLRARPFRRLPHALKHVEDPVLPGRLCRHLEQAIVIGVFVAHDVAAEIEHLDVKQALVEIEQVEHPSGTAVAADESMNRVELIVHHGDPTQRRQARFRAGCHGFPAIFSLVILSDAILARTGRYHSDGFTGASLGRQAPKHKCCSR